MKRLLIGILVFFIWMALSTWYYATQIYPVGNHAVETINPGMMTDTVAPPPESPPLPVVPDDLTLYFGFDKTTILNPNELQSFIHGSSKYLGADSTACVYLTGFTCDIGTASYNMDLGMRRARSVENYLRKNGLASGCIHLYSKGEDMPAVANTSEENRKLNRRVIIHINH